MAELKTKRTGESVDAFLKAIPDETRRKDCQAIAAMMRKATKAAPAMWGKGMVGYGSYKYQYASGHEGEWFQIGFAPRKGDITLYLFAGLHGSGELLGKLGKHTTGKGCLYLKKLADVDTGVLEKLIGVTVKRAREMST